MPPKPPLWVRDIRHVRTSQSSRESIDSYVKRASWEAIERSRALLARTADKAVRISPDDPDENRL